MLEVEQLQFSVDTIGDDDLFTTQQGIREVVSSPDFAAHIDVEKDRPGLLIFRKLHAPGDDLAAEFVLVFLGISIGVSLFSNLLFSSGQNVGGFGGLRTGMTSDKVLT